VSEEDKLKKPLPPELKVVADLLDACTTQGIFGRGFDINTFIKKAEFRGLVAEYWDDAKLDLAMARLRKQTIEDAKSEEDLDKILQTLASKIQVEVNQIRRIFYGIELANPKPKEKKGEEE
jgi:hypothetical protein